MKDKIANSIVLHQETINELKEIKKRLENSVPGSIKFMIKSKQLLWTDLYARTDTVNISYDTLQLVLDKAIEKEKERINKLIDMEIEKRLGGYDGDK
jgi:hypothetical protein